MKSLNINKQHTIQSPVTLEGNGLQTNEFVSLEILPAAADAGITFIREDLQEKPVIKADCDLVDSTTRCTRIAVGDVNVSTVEHLMAALVGSGIDNTTIKVKGSEIPILDGSSKPFLDSFHKVGILEQNAPKEWFSIAEPISVVDEQTGGELVVLPSEEYKISSCIKFDNAYLPMQFASIDTIQDFPKEIGAARTFCFYSEVQSLLSKGLIKGGSVDNAIVIMDEDLEKITHPDINKTHFSKNGHIVTQTPLRFDNEFARHKLLDVVGDLALVGKSFNGHVICTKPGHKINNALARKIKKSLSNNTSKTQNMAAYLTKPAVVTVDEIKKMLPHRYPFLLIDKVVEIGEQHIVVIKNVTINEPFFMGHFPDEPVMPGVLVLEAMAQAGGAYVLSKQDISKNKISTYFLSVDKCRFRQKVRPGDSLIIRMDLVYHNEARGIIEMTGKVFVQDVLCCDASLVAQVVKR